MPEVEVVAPEETDNDSVSRSVDILCQVLVKFRVGGDKSTWFPAPQSLIL